MEKIIVSCLESRVESNRSVYSRFLLAPFTEDYAVTVGTALRRALLSKVKNIAITSIHIQGVTHEFSTIVGVRESVLDLALNFQQIVLRTRTQVSIKPLASSNTLSSCKTELFDSTRSAFAVQNKAEQSEAWGNKAPAFESETAQVGYLQVQGPAVIHANDLKLPLGIECVDPTQYIATLSQEGLLVVKFLISEKKTFFNKNNNTITGTKINATLQNLKDKNEHSHNQHTMLGEDFVFTTLSRQSYAKRFAKTHSYKLRFSKKQGYTNVAAKRKNASKAELMQSDCKGEAEQSSCKSFASTTALGNKAPALLARALLAKTSFLHRLQSFALQNQSSACKKQNFLHQFRFASTHNKVFARTTEFFQATAYPEFCLGALNPLKLRPDKVIPIEALKEMYSFKTSQRNSKGGHEKHMLVKRSFAQTKFFDSNTNLSSTSSFVAKPSHPRFRAEKGVRTFSFRRKSRVFTSNFRSFDSTVCLRNTIFLDPIFNSVFQVNYVVEKDDLCNQPRERIVLELWTNGSIHPRQAIHQALFSLISTFSVFRKAFDLDSW